MKTKDLQPNGGVVWHTVGMLVWIDAEVAEDLVLHVEASNGAICGIGFRSPASPGARDEDSPLLAEAVRQLRAYFRRELRDFALPLEMQGTPFRKRVWAELLKIPYGETRSYADLAKAVGSPGAVRAVGAANGANPIAIVVPCHRVIGSGGNLVGYGGGLELKRRLLDLERHGPGLLQSESLSL